MLKFKKKEGNYFQAFNFIKIIFIDVFEIKTKKK